MRALAAHAALRRREACERGDFLDPVLGKPGDDLLSRVLRRSTIGAGAFHGRVRDGIGCSRSANITRPAKDSVKSDLQRIHPMPPSSAESAVGQRQMGADNESNQADRAISTG